MAGRSSAQCPGNRSGPADRNRARCASRNGVRSPSEGMGRVRWAPPRQTTLPRSWRSLRPCPSDKPTDEPPPSMSRRLQTVILLAGLVGIAFAVSRTVDTAQDQVLPSAPAWMVAGVLTLVAIVASARAWVALFSDLLDARA